MLRLISKLELKIINQIGNPRKIPPIRWDFLIAFMGKITISTLYKKGGYMKNIWFLIIGLILIGCGVYTLFSPITVLLASAIILGTIFIIMGIGYLMLYRETQSYMHVTLGVLDILIGFILLVNLGITAASIPIIFAFWCLFVGVIQLVAALELSEVGKSIEKRLLLSGIVGIVFSLLIFFNPVFGAFTISFLIGWYLILYGIFEVGRFLR